MKNYFYTLFLCLLTASISSAQNIRFSFDKVITSSTTTDVNIYAQTTSGTENLTGYTTYLYYDNAETTLTNLESSPTTGTPGMGWSASNQSFILFQSENNTSVGISHTGYFFYQNFDGGFLGTDITTTPTLLLTLSFDHTVGTTASGAVWLAETDEVPPMQYVDNLFNSYDVITMGMQSQVLPIELSHFDVKASGDQSLLDWSTASEINASHFEIEHSVDGIQFEKAGILRAEGLRRGETKYEWLHQSPKPGINYYRLKMVDVDNSFKRSAIKSVTFQEEQVEVNAPFPNPTMDGQASLQVWLPKEAEANLEVYNTLGQLLIDRKEQLYSGWNVLDLALSQLGSGTYWIQLEIGGKRYTQSLMVRME